MSVTAVHTRITNSSSSPPTPLLRSPDSPRFGRRLRGPGPLLIGSSPSPSPTPLGNAKSSSLMELFRGNTGFITIDGERVPCTSADLDVCAELGSGAFGYVRKAIFKPKNLLIAAKKFKDSMQADELLPELEIIQKCQSPYIVKYYGSYFKDGTVWILMECMLVSLDKFYLHVKKAKMVSHIPERILGKMAVQILCGLAYLADEQHIMHRDVKPSNILIGYDGSIKICDFGISKTMVKSLIFTPSSHGCQPYLSPERLAPSTAHAQYDVRSDVWSYGITLCELALLQFPYVTPSADGMNLLEVLTAIINDPSPTIPSEFYSPQFLDFVRVCLIKKAELRPKYKKVVEVNVEEAFCIGKEKTFKVVKVPPLTSHEFYIMNEACMTEVDILSWYKEHTYETWSTEH